MVMSNKSEWQHALYISAHNILVQVLLSEMSVLKIIFRRQATTSMEVE